MPPTPLRPSPRARSWSVCVAIAALAVGGSMPGLALAQDRASGGKQPAPADDPFADELNPFGKQPTTPAPEPTPPSTPRLPAPPRPPTKPPVQLPVPFPESDTPSEPAPRRERPTAPAAPPRDYRLPSEEPETWEPTEAEKIVAEAEKLDRAGDLAGARAKLQEALTLDPKLTIGWLALGVVARRLGDFEGSVEACSKGIAIDPNVAELYLRRGIAWYHLGLHGIALEDFEEASGMAYDDPRPELWRGLTLIELDRTLEAINAYATAIRRDNEFILGYLNRGLAYLSIDEPRKAEFDFNLAIRRDPRNARAWFNRGVAQSRQGRHAEAARSYGEALKYDPGMDSARRNKAAAETLAGRK